MCVLSVKYCLFCYRLLRSHLLKKIYLCTVRITKHMYYACTHTYVITHNNTFIYAIRKWKSQRTVSRFHFMRYCLLPLVICATFASKYMMVCSNLYMKWQLYAGTYSFCCWELPKCIDIWLHATFFLLLLAFVTVASSLLNPCTMPYKFLHEMKEVQIYIVEL